MGTIRQASLSKVGISSSLGAGSRWPARLAHCQKVGECAAPAVTPRPPACKVAICGEATPTVFLCSGTPAHSSRVPGRPTCDRIRAHLLPVSAKRDDSESADESQHCEKRMGVDDGRSGECQKRRCRGRREQRPLTESRRRHGGADRCCDVEGAL